MYGQSHEISWGESGDIFPSSPSSMLNSLLWSRLDVIKTHNPMQNPALIQIFYKPSQTHLTMTGLTWITLSSFILDVHTCTHTMTYTNMHTHIHTYIHTHIHTHTHTPKNRHCIYYTMYIIIIFQGCAQVLKSGGYINGF